MDAPWVVPIMLMGSFLMQAIVLLHNLWPRQSFALLLFLWVPLITSLRAREKLSRFYVGIALGCALGELVGTVVDVPWPLLKICLGQGRYDVTNTFFLCLFSLLLLAVTYKILPPPASYARRWMGPGLDSIAIVLGFSIIFSLAWVGRPEKNPRGYVALAQQKALAQLGPDYADYHFFFRDMQFAFRSGRYVIVRADLLAYQPALRDIEEVHVSWKEPWDGSR